jgi:hypothetical protein
MAKQKKKQHSKSRVEILQNHKRVGKKFIPLLLQYPEGKLSVVSWYHDMLPEFLWIALLCDQQGYRAAVDNAVKLSGILNSVVQDTKQKCGFCLASDYLSISDDERKEVISKIDQKLGKILDPCLGTILKFYPDFPMAWLVSDKWMNNTSMGLEGLESIKNAVRTRTDRFSKPAMECQVLAWFMDCKSGKIKFPAGMDIPDPNLISEYPETDRSRAMAARVRASLKAFADMREQKSDWANIFWRHSFEISPCEYPSEDTVHRLPEAKDLTGILEIGDKFSSEGRAELRDLWNKVRIDLCEPVRHNVIAGLLARSLQFASDIVNNPYLWRMPISAILIRCMVENEIRLQWLIKCGKDKDFKDYVEFGLGQEKLLVEHYKRISQSDRPDRQMILDDIKEREKWIDSQLYSFLLPVDIGGGAQGKDIRTLAEEADVLDLHRLVYSPLSSYVHGHWNAIARLNLSHCLNPLHGGHYLPELPQRPTSFSCALDAVNSYANCYELVSRAFTSAIVESQAALNYMTDLGPAFEAILEEAD